jgi:hypothetical protein
MSVPVGSPGLFMRGAGGGNRRAHQLSERSGWADFFCCGGGRCVIDMELSSLVARLPPRQSC